MTHILIVEDDITFATMMQTWLRKKGFAVEKASSVSAAIMALSDNSPKSDLILSGLSLPDHYGLFLSDWMKNHDMKKPKQAQQPQLNTP